MSAEIVPARVTVTFATGTVTLLPRRAPVGMSEPIRGETLVVFPHGSHDEAGLLGVLVAAAGRVPQYAPASIHAGEHGTVPGIAVLGLSQDEAAAVGLRLGLHHILFWDGRRASVISCQAGAE